MPNQPFLLALSLLTLLVGLLVSRPRRWCGPLLVLLWAGTASASERLEIRIGTLSNSGWAAEEIILALDLGSGEAQFRLSRLRLPAPVGELRNVIIDCRSTSLDGPLLACRGGRFQVQHPWLDDSAFSGELRFDRTHDRLELALADLPVAGGKLAADLSWQHGRWHMEATAVALDLERLAALAAQFMPLPLDTISGRTDLRFQLRGEGDGLTGQIAANLAETALGSSSGHVATEALALTLVTDVAKQGPDWRFVAEAGSQQGQLYVEPVFVDAGVHPFTIKANGRWSMSSGDLQLTDLRLQQAEVVNAEASLHWQHEAGLKHLQLWLREAVLPAAYQLYVQPFLIGSAFDSLTGTGRISGTASLVDGRPDAVRLALDGIELGAADERFRLHQLNGVLRWQALPDPRLPPSELRWQGGAIGGVAFGAAQIRLRTQADDLELLEPLHLPVLDGALEVAALRAEHLGQGLPTLHFDASLTPIQLRPISQALGWPEFGGTIAGRLPSLRYENGRLTLGGRLEIAAFNGQIRVDDLEVTEPLGRVPQLSANIAIDQIDLRALTEAFSFGRIEGRLSGQVDQLRLVNWQPASFDAAFYTPANDNSRHRISQRAIQSLSSIGGGAAAILSRGFLSLFKDFAYDRIGLSCTLREEVCHMRGIAPAENGGYYIVIGRLLPRVDVIGFQRQVSWPTLVEQLKSVTAAEGPIVR